MVHNGIEYGVMAAYAEGLGILRDANVGKKSGTIDAETTPLPHPEHYQYDFNLRDVAEVWRTRQRDRVVAARFDGCRAGGRSVAGEIRRPRLGFRRGALDHQGCDRRSRAAPVLTAALYERFSSRGEAEFANKLLSAMRFQFGGHLEKTVDKQAAMKGRSMNDAHSDALVFFGANGRLGL